MAYIFKCDVCAAVFPDENYQFKVWYYGEGFDNETTLPKRQYWQVCNDCAEHLRGEIPRIKEVILAKRRIKYE